MRNLAWATATILIIAGTAQAEITVQPVTEHLSHPDATGSHIGGRVAEDKTNIVLDTPFFRLDTPFFRSDTYQWPGTYFSAHFEGTVAYFALEDSSNILNVLVDDRVVATLTKPGSRIYAVSGLEAGEHNLRIERLTESQSGTGIFRGFAVPFGAPAFMVKPLARQVEFIGDSYTVGYGNTSGKRECTKDEVWATTDTQQAFGPLTAKHFNADYQINAYSGRGIVRNYDGFIGDPLPVLYPYALFDGKTAYDNPDWQPQIIVIGLGTNDFTTPLHDGEKWKTRDELHADYEATYVRFVQSLRAKNPKAFFILMATDQVEGEIQSEAGKVVSALQAAGETRIAFIPMNNLSFGGCDYHPDTEDDRRISDLLITFIDAHPGIWQGQ